MNKFYMTVGLPGSSKSTWAEINKEKLNFTIHSSDAIREELGDVNDQSKNDLVFNTLHKRIKEDLLNGKNVCYDATNLLRKRRMNFISNELKNIPCEKVCVLFATPYEVCLKNNTNRERKVPEEVIERMVKNFDVPCKQEGWNDIQIVWWDYEKEGMKFDFKDDVEKWRSVSHDNPHHTLSIGDHMIKAHDWFVENGDVLTFDGLTFQKDDILLIYAIMMHDCGKAFTKEFKNSKGEPSETAHFYQHHCVGSYLSLFYLKDWRDDGFTIFDENSILYISLLIGLHMNPFLKWKNSKKAEEKDRKLFGDKIIDSVLKLHQADLAAH